MHSLCGVQLQNLYEKAPCLFHPFPSSDPSLDLGLNEQVISHYNSLQYSPFFKQVATSYIHVQKASDGEHPL